MSYSGRRECYEAGIDKAIEFLRKQQKEKFWNKIEKVFKDEFNNKEFRGYQEVFDWFRKTISVNPGVDTERSDAQQSTDQKIGNLKNIWLELDAALEANDLVKSRVLVAFHLKSADVSVRRMVLDCLNQYRDDENIKPLWDKALKSVEDLIGKIN